MSDFICEKGFIYPLRQMTLSEVKRLHQTIKDPFVFEIFDSGQGYCSSYLLLRYCGGIGDGFGVVRDLTPDALAYAAPKFREALGSDINPSLLKYIEHCYPKGSEDFDWYEDYMTGQEPAKEAIPITDEWLDSLPQFEQCGTGWWYTTKETPDSPSPHDVEIARREYGYCVTVFTDGCESQLPIKTVETLVGFLRLCGLDGFADKIAKVK